MKENKITMGDVTTYLEDLLQLGLIDEKILPDGTLGYKVVESKIKYAQEHPEVFDDPVEN